MPRVPLTFRRSMYEQHSSEVEVGLLTIEHDDLEAPLRLSTDPTERLYIDEESGFPIYGTVSNGETFIFVEMSLVLPDDKKDTPPTTSLSFENIDSRYVEIAESFSSPATATLEVVLASAPNFVTTRLTRLRLTQCTYTETNMTFALSRLHLQSEPFGVRQSRNRAPALHGIATA